MKMLFAALLGVSLCAAAKKEVPAELNLTSLDGGKVHLSDLRGKVVVVNFWATWCGPCRQEMPLIVEAAKHWEGKGIVFIGVSLDDKKTRAEIPDFLAKFQVRYPIWVGATAADTARLHLGQAIPDTIFLDEEGVIFARVKGELHADTIGERLAWITGGRTGPAPPALADHLK